MEYDFDLPDDKDKEGVQPGDERQYCNTRQSVGGSGEIRNTRSKFMLSCQGLVIFATF
jgi:hypothetical protein